MREYENLQRADNPTETLGVLQDVVFDAGRACASQVCICRSASSSFGMHVSSQKALAPVPGAKFSLWHTEYIRVL